MRSGKTIARGQWFSATHTHWYEFPTDDPAQLEVWCYTDKLSYAPGETVQFHTNTTAQTYSLEVVRDGADPEVVYSVEALPGQRYPTPTDANEVGCGWPVAHEWPLPADLRSGGYVVYARARNGDGEEREQQHFFVVRPARPGDGANILLVCATSTWIAYNEWGGSNNYWLAPLEEGDMAVRLNIQRPWSRGFVWVPEGAPRSPIDSVAAPGNVPRYPQVEWAFANGFSKYYAAAGWATYERLFVCWAEANGYAVDVATQHDLHFHPEILDHYPCVAIVGHDEYYSWEMRDALERYLDNGGHIARFGGNFVWQIRFEDEGLIQVCYKEKARTEDPLRDTDHKHLLTSAWEDYRVARAPAETLGLNGLRSAVYAHWSAFNPRSTGGYTVYRPDHWVFESSDLYYGDVFGGQSKIFGYEVDGVAFTFKNGLPYPTGEDGAPANLEILAMGVTAAVEEDHGNKGAYLFDGMGSATLIADMLFGDPSPENIEKIRYGAGMIAVYKRGAGTVFNAGSCEWVNGLKQRDFYTEQITRNVLDRFTQGV